MHAPQPVQLILLAAGQARRLGRDKPTLPWGRRTLLEYVLAQFPPRCVERTIVVVNPVNAPAVLPLLPPGAEIAINDVPGAEMLASVRLGAKKLAAGGGPLCVHPVDCFAVVPPLVELLFEAAGAEPDLMHVPAHNGRRGHPVLVPQRFWHAIDAIPEGEGLSYVLRNAPQSVREHEWHDPLILDEVDTPEDYARHAPRG